MSEIPSVKTDPIEYLSELFARHGKTNYYGEAVNQLEHALQSAQAACQSGADDSAIIAALLHDVGHLLDAEGEPARLAEVDRFHEKVGARWLTRYFPADVTEPVALHVDAKRYLCAVEPDYFEQLSPASVQSLKMQGGPMNDEEVENFARDPYSAVAIELRRWDDQAKVVGMVTPDMDAFVPMMQRLVRNQT